MAEQGKREDESTETASRTEPPAESETSEKSAESEEPREASSAAAEADMPDDGEAKATDDDAEGNTPGEEEHAQHAARQSAAAPTGAAWAAPIARFEARWTWLEARLITFVLLSQLLALVSWVFLNGLSESVAESAGVVFRGTLFAIGLGLTAWFGGKKLDEDRRRNATLAAIGLGVAAAIAWRKLCAGAMATGATEGLGARMALLDKATVAYFDNIKGWLQEGSTLTLLGGLRGLGTRLTLWLALLGGSLATAAGKHIHIDVIFRFLPKRLRIPAAIINALTASVVCFAATWGFFDHLAIESYGSRAEDPPAEKIANASHHIGDHLFFVRKQLGLDLRSLPHVLAGERYDQWMSAGAWNEWLGGAGFEDRFPKDQIEALRVPPEVPSHTPFVISPAGETTRGALAHTLSLVFPFGLLAIGLRFLIRALLTLSGHISPDPDEAHKEDLHGAATPAGEGGV